MAVETLKAVKVNVLLSNGISPTGNIRTTNSSIGTLSPDRWDADKVLAIFSAAADIYAVSAVEVEGIKTYTLQNN